MQNLLTDLFVSNYQSKHIDIPRLYLIRRFAIKTEARMSTYVGFNRRHPNGERRTFDTTPGLDRRGMDRRRAGTDSYVFVMGDAGINKFGLLMAFALICLIAIALTRSVMLT